MDGWDARALLSTQITRSYTLELFVACFTLLVICCEHIIIIILLLFFFLLLLLFSARRMFLKEQFGVALFLYLGLFTIQRTIYVGLNSYIRLAQ